MITTQPELNRIAKRRPADNLNRRAVTKPHLQQPSANVRITPDRHNLAAAPDTQLI